MNMSEGVIIAIIVSAVSLAGSVFMYFKGAKKDEVDALRGIIKELRDYIDDLEKDKIDLKDWAEALVCQVKEAGLDPVRFGSKTQPRKRTGDT